MNALALKRTFPTIEMQRVAPLVRTKAKSVLRTKDLSALADALAQLAQNKSSEEVAVRRESIRSIELRPQTRVHDRMNFVFD